MIFTVGFQFVLGCVQYSAGPALQPVYDAEDSMSLR